MPIGPGNDAESIWVAGVEAFERSEREQVVREMVDNVVRIPSPIDDFESVGEELFGGVVPAFPGDDDGLFGDSGFGEFAGGEPFPDDGSFLEFDDFLGHFGDEIDENGTGVGIFAEFFDGFREIGIAFGIWIPGFIATNVDIG